MLDVRSVWKSNFSPWQQTFSKVICQWLEVRQICIVKLCREFLPCRVNLSGESLLYLGAAGPIYKGAVHRIIRFSVEGCKRLLWSCTRQKCLAQVDQQHCNLSHFSRAFMNLIYRPWMLLVSVNVPLQMKCWKTDKHAFVCRWAYPVKCSNVVLADNKETVLEVHVEYDRSKSTKPKVCTWLNFSISTVVLKVISFTSLLWLDFSLRFSLIFGFVQGVIHWVAEPSPGVEPLKVEARLFDKLFRSEVCSFILLDVLHIWTVWVVSLSWIQN